ncbi:ribosome small subunit-dependent GTPase A [Aestuariibacter halophilus]|uniref:Small ribosomal subunit biogenesis GTPase RsgA n=1 Tax=Fluctibacter halophilus TaxID=226011 RepID=A0ABS8G504_9ALTE|nr:ribosome small subunit-dependent GTPase A [Aestuariibacter halophilus]MCC2614739.1 ribosome small subunit-dependent GTPase A [Aestuariibacter halophilus]
MTSFQSLASMGWQPFFQQQLSLDEWEHQTPARVASVHRDAIDILVSSSESRRINRSGVTDLCVGDWLLLDNDDRICRVLAPQTLFRRKAAGTGLQTQGIAANVDTALIVCSLNQDFNLHRIERYLALIKGAGAEPVVVLTKMDSCDDPQAFVQRVTARMPDVPVEAVNGLDADSCACLSPWLKPGKTLVLLGSSGVGKSTLMNTLMGQKTQSTAGIREDDSKGRHTTTARYLRQLPGGAWLMDTPGMREIQLSDCADGIASAFADIEALAKECRFGDCSHTSEPGCAVTSAVASGVLEQDRLSHYQKLQREDAFNSASLAERRAQDKALGKFYKRVQNSARETRGR